MTDEDKNWAIEELKDVLTTLGSGFEGMLYTVREFPDIKQELLRTSHHLQKTQELLQAVDLI